MSKLRRMFVKIACSDPNTLEAITAIQAILIGFWYCLPGNTFSSSTTYAVMAALAPDLIWGVYFMAMGSIQLVSMHLASLKNRRRYAWFAMVSWIFIDLGFWSSGSTSAAAMTYVTFVLVAVWSYAALSAPDRVKCNDSN